MSRFANGTPPPFPGLVGADGEPLKKPRKPNPESEYQDDFAVPHVLQFGSILSGAYKTYWHNKHDEALKQSREDALAMRRDAFLMSLLAERKLAVAGRKWEVAIDDARDPWQKLVRDGLTRLIKKTPHWKVMLLSLLEAVWYGRYGEQVAYRWDEMLMPGAPQQQAAPGLMGAAPASAPTPPTKQRVMRVWKHLPTNGDKFGHRWDGTPYVQVYGGSSEKDFPNAEMTWTTSGGRALLLTGEWRERFLIHTHYDHDDGDYWEAEMAEAVFGVGIRTRLFWWDYLKREWLAKISDWVDRVGLGVSLWYYESGNPRARAEAASAAKEQSHRTNILVPWWPAGKGGGRQPGMERIETPTAGSEVLVRLLQKIEEIQERFVIGQQASSRSQTSGLGTHNTDMQEATKQAIVEMDSDHLADTLTGDDDEPGLISTLLRWNYPWADFPVRFQFKVAEPDPEKRMSAATMAYNMQLPLRQEEVYEITGFTPPQEGDAIVQMPQPQPAMPGGGMPPGMDGGMPPDAGGQPPGGGGPGAPGGEPDPSDLQALLGGGAGGQPAGFARRGVPRRYEGYEDTDAGKKAGEWNLPPEPKPAVVAKPATPAAPGKAVAGVPVKAATPKVAAQPTPPRPNPEREGHRKAFLDHLRANPFDHGTRAIYSDWLEEGNEPKEAERQRWMANVWPQFAKPEHPYSNSAQAEQEALEHRAYWFPLKGGEFSRSLSDPSWRDFHLHTLARHYLGSATDREAGKGETPTGDRGRPATPEQRHQYADSQAWLAHANLDHMPDMQGSREHLPGLGNSPYGVEHTHHAGHKPDRATHDRVFGNLVENNYGTDTQRHARPGTPRRYEGLDPRPADAGGSAATTGLAPPIAPATHPRQGPANPMRPGAFAQAGQGILHPKLATTPTTEPRAPAPQPPQFQQPRQQEPPRQPTGPAPPPPAPPTAASAQPNAPVGPPPSPERVPAEPREAAPASGLPVYGPSKAQAVWHPYEPYARAAKYKAAELLGPERATPEHLASLVGAPDDAKVVALPSGDRIKVFMEHPDLDTGFNEPFVRKIGKDKSGKLFIENEFFFVRPDRQGGGLGRQVFSRQVEQASQAGVAYLQCHAAKYNPRDPAKPHIGYWLWPLFGYDQEIGTRQGSFSRNAPDAYDKVRRQFPDAKTIRDIITAPEGLEWWKKNGSDLFQMKFNLAAGSDSMRFFEDYRKRSAAKGKPFARASSPERYFMQPDEGDQDTHGIDEPDFDAEEIRWAEEWWRQEAERRRREQGPERRYERGAPRRYADEPGEEKPSEPPAEPAPTLAKPPTPGKPAAPTPPPAAQPPISPAASVPPVSSASAALETEQSPASSPRNEGAPRPSEPDAASHGPMLRGLFDRISQPDGGFTYHVHGHTEPTQGYALSIYPERSFARPVAQLRVRDLVEYIQRNEDVWAQPHHYFGGWHDPVTHQVFLDVSVVLPDEEQARQLALKHDQIAYFDLKRLVSVAVNRQATSGGAAGESYARWRSQHYDRRSGQQAFLASALPEGDPGADPGVLPETDGPRAHSRGDRRGAGAIPARRQSGVVLRYDEEAGSLPPAAPPPPPLAAPARTAPATMPARLPLATKPLVPPTAPGAPQSARPTQSVTAPAVPPHPAAKPVQATPQAPPSAAAAPVAPVAAPPAPEPPRPSMRHPSEMVRPPDMDRNEWDQVVGTIRRLHRDPSYQVGRSPAALSSSLAHTSERQQQEFHRALDLPPPPEGVSMLDQIAEHLSTGRHAENRRPAPEAPAPPPPAPRPAPQAAPADPAQARVSRRTEAVAARAAAIQFTDNPTGGIDGSDHSEIEDAMSLSERQAMYEHLSEARDSYVDEQMEGFDPEVDEDEIAQNEFPQRQVRQAVQALIDQHAGDSAPALTEQLDEWYDETDLDGPDAIADLHERLTREGGNDALRQALTAYHTEAQDAVQQAIDRERESQSDSYRESLEDHYDDSEDRANYLDNFYQENQDRFQGEPGVWGTQGHGEWAYSFDTESGERYTIGVSTMGRIEGNQRYDLQFHDERGNFRITGRAGAAQALEVFGHVSAAALAFVMHKDPPILTFSAAEPSRQKLYDHLVKSLAKAKPEYAAAAIKLAGGGREYVLAKREIMERAKSGDISLPFHGEVEHLVYSAQRDHWAYAFLGRGIPVRYQSPPQAVAEAAAEPSETPAPSSPPPAVPQAQAPRVQSPASPAPMAQPAQAPSHAHQLPYWQLRGRLEGIRSSQDLKHAEPLLRQIWPDYTETHQPDVANDFAHGIWRMANRGDEIHRTPMADLSERHRAAILRAIERGEIVPPEVLAEYPDLHPPQRSQRGVPARYEWVEERGPHGGRRWRDTETGNISYHPHGKARAKAHDEGRAKSQKKAQSALGSAWQQAKAAGHYLKHREELVKAWGQDRISQAVNKLPAQLQVAVHACWWLVRAGTKTAFASYIAGQKLAQAVAEERGASTAQAQVLRGILGVIDLATVKVVVPVATAIGGPTVGAAASFAPVGSLSYLAYATARDPLAVMRAAQKLVKKTAEATDYAAADVRRLAQRLMATLKGLEGDRLDWYSALVYAALDHTGDLRQALAVAEKVLQDYPSGYFPRSRQQREGRPERYEEPPEPAASAPTVPAPTVPTPKTPAVSAVPQVAPSKPSPLTVPPPALRSGVVALPTGQAPFAGANQANALGVRPARAPDQPTQAHPTGWKPPAPPGQPDEESSPAQAPPAPAQDSSSTSGQSAPYGEQTDSEYRLHELQPPPGARHHRTPAHEELERAVVTHSEPLSGDTLNHTEKLTFADGTHGIFKPRDGENFGRDAVSEGTYYRREALTSALAEHLGMGDLVPPTVVRTVDGQIGSVMKWVDGARKAQLMGDWHKYDGPEDLARAAAFDFLTLNTDRHDGNWMVKDGKLVLIDHGLLYPDTHDDQEWGHSMLVNKAIEDRARLPEQVKTWDRDPGHVRAMLLHAGLGNGEIGLVMDRLHLMAKAARAGWTFGQLWREADIRTVSEAAHPRRVKDSPAPPFVPTNPPPATE